MSAGTKDTRNIGGLHLEYRTYERQKCFVGHSREAEWRDDILSACAKVLPKFGLEPWYAADHFDPTKPLRDKVVELIANARYGIYDLSSWQDRNGEWHLPRNVLIELGMAIALNRPALLLRHTSNKALPLSACLQGVELLKFAGETTLKRALEEQLPQWFDVPPDRDWLNRFCIFGNRVCGFREEHPRAQQWRHETLRCHVSDGLNKDHPGFQTAEREEIRAAFEDIFDRYNDLEFDYLDELSPVDCYQFILCSYCQTVRSTPLAVYRILPHTPAEVFIAIGMSIALETLFEYDIPQVLLVRQEQDLPSLLRGYEVIEAVNSSEVKRKLKRSIPVVMEKVRETAWKPRPLPFIEIAVQPYVEPIYVSSEQALEVEVVSPEVGYMNIRPTPSTAQPPITQVGDGAVLEALEPEGDTRAKVGQESQWLHIRTPDGIEGYVAAWYLRLHVGGGKRIRLRTPNPFTDVVAVRDPARFVGREPLLERLLRVLKGGSVALVGERKIGKSSLLHRLANLLRQEPGQAVVFWDFFNREDVTRLLAKAIKELDSDGETWEEFKRAVHNRRVVLLLDEFDVAPEVGFDLDVLRRYRALCQVEQGLRLVTASRTLPKQIFPKPGAGSWPYDFLGVQPLGPFTPDEVHRLLAHPWAPDALHFDTPTCEELVRLSGRHPHRLQRAAHHRYETLCDSAYDWRVAYELDLEALQ